jgi:hypothetical protein
MTAGFYISGLITPTYTPLRRGRVAMAKKKRMGRVAVVRCFYQTVGFSVYTTQIRIHVRSNEQCSRVIGLRIKRLFPDIVSAALTLHQSALRTTETHFVKGASADHRTQRI